MQHNSTARIITAADSHCVSLSQYNNNRTILLPSTGGCKSPSILGLRRYLFVMLQDSEGFIDTRVTGVAHLHNGTKHIKSSHVIQKTYWSCGSIPPAKQYKKVDLKVIFAFGLQNKALSSSSNHSSSFSLSPLLSTTFHLTSKTNVFAD